MLIVMVNCLSDLQTVNLTLRILFHPDPTLLPSIYTNIGIDYDERVMPSIVDEVLKSVVVRKYLQQLQYFGSERRANYFLNLHFMTFLSSSRRSMTRQS